MSLPYLRAGERQIAFVAPRSLARALDAAAGRAGVSRAGYVRRVVADHLRASGSLAEDARVAPGAPLTEAAE